MIFGISQQYRIKKEFNSEPIYNKNVLKTETNCYSNEATDA